VYKKNKRAKPNFKTMKAIITTTVLIMLAVLGLQAQESTIIKGQVCNGLNHMPLKDCHVYVDGQVAGTLSNRYGEFELKIPGKYLDRSLYISYVGFETFSQPIREIGEKDLDVMMVESPIWLDEVIISSDYEEIVKIALDSVRNRFDNEEDLLQAFYEVLLEKDKDQHILMSVMASSKTE
jgi:hypothetical protein